MANFSENSFIESTLLFSIIGKIAVGYVAFRVLYKAWQLIKLYLLSPALGLSLDLKKYGKWAVVTGATDGIGKAYAHELAKKGMKLVLISRTASRLSDTAKEIESKYKDAEVKWVVADFSEPDIYHHIAKELEGLDIGVLVNNVGVCPEDICLLHEHTDEETKRVIFTNNFSVIFMTKLVVGRMVEKGAGVIVNISSLAGKIPMPMGCIYGASKTFVNVLSKSLDMEYKSKGIVVQCVCPGVVATKMSRKKNATFLAPLPDTFASFCINTLGLHNDVTGYLGHELQEIAFALMGDKRCGEYIYKKAMKRKEEKSKGL